MSTTKSAVEEIKRGAALAFFACAWADAEEEAGQAQGGEIMARMPADIDPAAIHAANTLAMQFIAQFDFKEPGLNDSQKLAALYMKAVNCDREGADRELSPELFGHYLAMQAMGTGVGLESFGEAVREAFPVPYVEFGSHSLERDYFEEVADDE